MQVFYDNSMTTKRAPEVVRRVRRDAERNRARILEAAREAFTHLGSEASLDDIARQAGVGPGTLYRNFATRDALIEAVYRTEVEKLAAAADQFAQQLPPIEALRAWMLLFVDHIATKQIIAPALNSLVGGPGKLYESAQVPIREAVDGLVLGAVKAGEMRPDLESFDLLRALIGVSHVSKSPDWQKSARRLVDILSAGSRPGA